MDELLYAGNVPAWCWLVLSGVAGVGMFMWIWWDVYGRGE